MSPSIPTSNDSPTVWSDPKHRTHQNRTRPDQIDSSTRLGNWSIRLIYHGRAVCNARKPQCDRCALSDLCPSANLSELPIVPVSNKKAPIRDECPLEYVE
ncbi:MAG: hypothetical protein HC936_08075 [Leptolyngbyaceae cyanobacterium SU_3_3]|nr:hypothetical protein [Leptolyngbyaceae cyanobacterium SU_3_3]